MGKVDADHEAQERCWDGEREAEKRIHGRGLAATGAGEGGAQLRLEQIVNEAVIEAEMICETRMQVAAVLDVHASLRR